MNFNQIKFAKVAIFIDGIKKVSSLINAYIARVTAAGGVLEGLVCLKNKLIALDYLKLLTPASLVFIPSGYKSGVVYSQVPTSGAGDLDFTRASTATRINSSSLIESVASGVPRLDYPIGGGCPSLLLEPQRTNNAKFSEQFDNSYWDKYRGDVGINAQISPDGTQNADTFTSSVGATILPGIATTNYGWIANTDYSLSLFVKKIGTENNFRIGYVDTVAGFLGGTANYNFSTNTATIVTQAPNGLVTASMENYGNGWYRLILNFKITASPTFNYFEFSIPSVSITNTFAIWGAQLEAGSYPTSYIPTTSATVTRVADTAGKTGITSLIGQTEGTIFIDTIVGNATSGGATNFLNTNRAANTISSFSLLRITANNTIRFQQYFGNGTFDSFTLNSTNSFVSGQRIKIAVRYKSGDYAMYINGVLESTNTNTISMIGSKSELYLNDSAGYYAEQENMIFSQVVLYKSGLSNSQLASLTTI